MCAYPNGTQLDIRGLPSHQQHSMLLGTFQLLRPHQAMRVRLDGQEDALRKELAERLPGRFEWTRGADGITVRRIDPVAA